jgi:adenine-specific DNA-methyltransferase
MASSNYDKLIETLKEVFMLDKAELDFGIYRIMNQKRKDIEQFLEKDLVPQVKQILAENLSFDKQALQKELEESITAARTLGADPDILPKVQQIKARLGEAADLVGLENEVFSLLANFFKRYYDNGDFVSMRRYKKDVYAIPYEGEEVKLHWANADQYYIKTAEYFKNYRFKLNNGKTIAFELVDASTEQNNNKTQNGKDRRFAIYKERPVELIGDELRINFTYEPTDKKTKQDELLEEAFELAKLQIKDDFLLALALRPTEKDKTRTLLQKHLRDYVARNTFDYFIHKDLHSFLTRELDFYIKNEVLFIDDINTLDEKEFLKNLSKIKTIKCIGEKIITFLAQLENFQKKLWLKKKFIVEAHYCITLDRVPQEFYGEIAKNTSQINEWIRLFSIDEIKTEGKNEIFGDGIVSFSIPLTNTFFQQNRYLLLDTRFFSTEFKNQLISKISELDEQCDGLLVNSDNFHALNLLSQSFAKEIECIHIDPPYNTNSSGFLYKNSFEHSSWLSMMADRLLASLRLMNEDGVLMCHIDEHEVSRLELLFDVLNTVDSGTLIWDKGAPVTGAYGLATQHEYVLMRSNKHVLVKSPKQNIDLMREKAHSIIEQHKTATDKAISDWRKWLRTQDSLSKAEQIYDLIDDEGRIYRSDNMSATEKRTDQKFYKPLIHPVTNIECPVPDFGWRYTPETMKKHLESNTILFGSDHTKMPRRKVFIEENISSQMPSIYKSGFRGKPELDSLDVEFPYAHSTEFYSYLMRGIKYNKRGFFMDFFAGSGTTGHAVINLNRNDGGKRKYILIEMGEYFSVVTKPRIQRVVYSDHWKEGKPISRNGSSHCFKYIHLESYEDTLNNLGFKQDQNQLSTLQTNPIFKEGYMLNYMLDVESEDSLLNLEWFKDPFNCFLNITRNNEMQPTKVDMVETFNYLIGLVVESYAAPKKGFVVVTGKTLAEEKILVVWRDCTQHDNKSLNEFLQKSKYNPLDTEFDRIYVNGDNNVENLKVGEEKWKVVLIEEEFKKKMFSEQ